jgi:hypothetical protein
VPDVPPREPVKQFIGVHVRRDIAEDLAKLALQNHRSLAGELRVAIELYLEAAKAKGEDGVAA